MCRTRVLLVIAPVLVAGIAAPLGGAPKDDWAVWRGPNANGVVAGVPFRADALAPVPKVAWRAEVGQGWSAVTIAGGRAFTMGNVADTDTVYGLDATTGVRQWTHTYPCTSGSYPGPRATPVVDGDSVYTVSRDGDVYSLAVRDGSVNWTRNITATLGAKPPKWGHSASVCVSGKMLLLNGASHGLALDKASGEPLWKSPPGVSGYSTPVTFSRSGKPAMALFGAKAVHVVDVATGGEILSHPWPTAYDVNASDPVIAGETMFISSGYDTGAALLNIAGAVAGVLWKNTSLRSHFGSPVVLGGHLYGIDGNTGKGAQLACVELASGTVKWTHPTGFGALIAVNEHLLVLGEDGTLRVAAADPAGYREVSTAPVLGGGKGKCWTAPTFAGGFVYVRNSEGRVVCIDMR